jgi:hypothetical protein
MARTGYLAYAKAHGTAVVDTLTALQGQRQPATMAATATAEIENNEAEGGGARATRTSWFLTETQEESTVNDRLVSDSTLSEKKRGRKPKKSLISIDTD